MRIDAVIGVREAVADEENSARWIRDNSRALRRDRRFRQRTSVQQKHHGQNNADSGEFLGIHG